MQALESLNDTQVNDFLSGKSPLNLSMRLGDHMMLIQLQLSTLNPSSSSSTSSASASSSSSSSSHHHNGVRIHRTSSKSKSHHHHHHHHSHHHNSNHQSSSSSAASYSDVSPINFTPPTSSSSLSSSVAATTSSSTIVSPEKLKKISPLSELAALRKKHNCKEEHSTIPDLSTTLDDSIVMVEPINKIEVESTTSPTATTITTTANNSDVTEIKDVNLDSLMFQREIENINKIVRKLTDYQTTKDDDLNQMDTTTIPPPTQTDDFIMDVGTIAGGGDDEQQSPIKSLSNLVSKNIPIDTDGGSTESGQSDPISAKLTSCLCKSLDTNSNNSSSCCDVNCQMRPSTSKSVTMKTTESPEKTVETTAEASAQQIPNDSSSPSTSTSSTSPSKLSSKTLLHKIMNNSINKHKINKNILLRKVMNTIHQIKVNRINNEVPQTENNSTTAILNETVTPTTTTPLTSASTTNTATTSLPPPHAVTATPTASSSSSSIPPIIDTCALAEASRNLTQTLRKLSKEVFTNKIDVNAEDNSRRMGTGAVIESMKNHGRGIYSGTFSGTLNPALQDRYGRPKRDISTIIHILNDLLSAAPQYRRGNAKIKFEPSNKSAIKEVIIDLFIRCSCISYCSVLVGMGKLCYV